MKSACVGPFGVAQVGNGGAAPALTVAAPQRSRL